MIPKTIIQLYNNVNRVKNSKKITNNKLPSRYKTLGKRISFIFMKLYTHSTMSLDSKDTDEKSLYHVGLILQHLGLIKINCAHYAHHLYIYDKKLHLTPMGKKFMYQKLLNRLVHTSMFPKISIDIFLNLYRVAGTSSFYLDLMWLLVPPALILMSSSMFNLTLNVSRTLIKMYGYSFIALILENIKAYTVSNKFQFAYVDLLDFCKRHGKNHNYIKKCVKKFYTSDDNI